MTQYRFIQNYLSENKIEFYAVQPRRERPKKILLKGIPKSFPIKKVKNELERLQFDIHRVSQLCNFRTKEPYPCFFFDNRELQRVIRPGFFPRLCCQNCPLQVKGTQAVLQLPKIFAFFGQLLIPPPL